MVDLETRDTLDEAIRLVELVQMAAGDLEPEWSRPLRLGAQAALDRLDIVKDGINRPKASAAA